MVFFLLIYLAVFHKKWMNSDCLHKMQYRESVQCYIYIIYLRCCADMMYNNTQ